jgi:type IV pilus assembly protein PilA
MLQTLKARLADRKHDEGFTLIELMVVVLIIAILLAIAIPTFLGAQNKAKDRSAQSSLRDTVVAAKSIFTDTQDYTKADATTLGTNEPALQFVGTGSSTDPKTVSVAATTTAFKAASQSKSGTCFYIQDSMTGGTTYAKVASASSCSPGDTVTYSGTGWN